MSSGKKQLCVVLAVATWITLVIVWGFLPIHYYDNSHRILTEGETASGYESLGVDWIKSNLIVCSIPAILFDGILF
jgi:hypothetical protein